MSFLKLKNNYIPLLTILLSLIVAWTLIPITTGFPMFTFVILLTALSSLIYLVKKNKGWFDRVLYLGVIMLSFFTIYRANILLQFFNLLSIVFLISILARPINTINGIFHLVLSPFTVFFNTLLSQNLFKLKFTLPKFMKEYKNAKEYILTIFITIAALFVILPLLASANPLFNNLLQQTIQLFNLDWLSKYIFTDSLAVYIFRIIFFLFFIYSIPRALSITINGIKDLGTLPNFPINYLVPKITLAAILLIFFVTQLQLYFASPELLQSLGYTNSRLTNEVFNQVILVAFIVMLFAYFDNKRKKWDIGFTYFLILEALFLIGMALKSVNDYSTLFGFTQKRLWGYTAMTWLTGAIGIYLYHFYKQTSFSHFIKQIITFSVVVIFIINFLNFDYLIYHTAKPSIKGEIDYDYLSTLSADAHSENDILTKLISDIEKSSVPDQSKIISANYIIRSIYHLRSKYEENININSFNISEYQEYQATKQLNIENYQKIIDDKLLIINKQSSS